MSSFEGEWERVEGKSFSAAAPPGRTSKLALVAVLMGASSCAAIFVGVASRWDVALGAGLLGVLGSFFLGCAGHIRLTMRPDLQGKGLALAGMLTPVGAFGLGLLLLPAF